MGEGDGELNKSMESMRKIAGKSGVSDSDRLDVMKQLSSQLLVENQRLREALEWYADGNNWAESSFSINHKIIEQTIANANHDRGERARQALAKGYEKPEKLKL